MLWRLFFFLAMFASLQALYGAAKGSWVERLVIDQAIVKTAAWLIDTVDPSVGVTPAGPRLRAPGGGINILNGCEGTEAAFLMMAAMLVAPLSMRARLSGLLVGTLVVFVLNQARVVAPLLLIIAVAAFFVFWLNRYAATPDVPRVAATAQPG